MKIKGFDTNLCCRDMQYEVGKEYSTGAEHITSKDLCSDKVLHYCDSLQKVHPHYNCNDTNNRYCEIEVLGEEVTDGDKYGSNRIRIVREIVGEELELLKGHTNGNTGLFNSGSHNSGNYNSGYYNSGNLNSGDWNSGNLNSGDWNSGYRNSGYHNSGNWNSGDRNSGDWNSGDFNSGDKNSGDKNSGDFNNGDFNSGYYNSGNQNSGDRNSGNHNSGDWNSGDYNSGDRNSGDCNSGDRNSGHGNSGDCNSGYRNSGVFCNRTKNDTIMLFNKESNITWDDWYSHPAYRASSRLKVVEWRYWDEMTESERSKNKDAETCGGYLKKYGDKEAWANLWKNLDDDEKTSFKTLPNFDASIFEDITGIKI